MHDASVGSPVRAWGVLRRGDVEAPPDAEVRRFVFGQPTGDGPLMRFEYDRLVGADAPPALVDAVVDLEVGWIARLRLEPGDGSVRLLSVVFERTTDDDQLGARLIRRLRLGPVIDGVKRALGDPWVAGQLGPEWRPSVVPRRPGRGGRDPLYFALVAQDYVEALESAPKAPIRFLIDRMSQSGETVTEGQLRARLGTARRMGLLTKAEAGAAGGRLTAKAKKLIGNAAREV